MYKTIEVREQLSEIIGKLRYDKTSLVKLHWSLTQQDEEECLWNLFGRKQIAGLPVTKKAFIAAGKRLNMKQIALELLHTTYKKDLEEGLELLSKKFPILSQAEPVLFGI